MDYHYDEFDVEKSIPKQIGHAVTGNRRQNYSAFRINDFGFNSFREFTPTEDKIEIAIIGDSFIATLISILSIFVYEKYASSIPEHFQKPLLADLIKK